MRCSPDEVCKATLKARAQLCMAERRRRERQAAERVEGLLRVATPRAIRRIRQQGCQSERVEGLPRELAGLRKTPAA